ncbi:MAG: hypothetical protein AAFY60_09615, partial [Myxococcota bacterium]
MKRVEGGLSGLIASLRSSTSIPAEALSPQKPVLDANAPIRQPLSPQVSLAKGSGKLMRPVAAETAEGQAVIAQALKVAAEHGVDSSELMPLNVMVDPLGMTHVRFDRQYGGLPVYGEQFLVQLGGAENGTRDTVTNAFAEMKPGLLNESKVSADRVVRAAREILKEYGEISACDVKPVIYYCEHLGHHVRAFEVSARVEAEFDQRLADVTILFHGTTGEPLGGSAHSFGVWKPRMFAVEKAASAAPENEPINSP